MIAFSRTRCAFDTICGTRFVSTVQSSLLRE